MSGRASGGHISPWEEAASKLSSEEIKLFQPDRDNKLVIIEDILQAVRDKRQACLDKGWKFSYWKGKHVVLRDLLEKIVRWVDKFKQVVDVAVQYDTGHASLPWAGIRTLLQLTVNDVDTFGRMLEGVERIAKMAARYAVIEVLYLKNPVGPKLHQSVVEVYSSILEYLTLAHRYYRKSTAARMINSSLQAEPTQVQSQLSRVIELDQDVTAHLRLRDTEVQTQILAENIVVRDQTRQGNLKLEEVQRRQQALENILKAINEPILRMQKELSELSDGLDRKKRAEILRWLSPMQYRQHQARFAEDLLPGSGEWLRSKGVFKDWMNSSTSSALWLHGPLGCGKTMLVSSIIHWMDVMRDSFNGTFARAFIFCTRNPAEPRRANPEGIFRALLKQLGCSTAERPINAAIVALYEKKCSEAELDGLDPEPPTSQECKKIILDIAKEGHIILIIDALDECDPTKLHELLALLEELRSNSENFLKILVSSRDDFDGVSRLQDWPNIQISAVETLQDVRDFVKLRVDQVIRERRLLGGNISSTLREKVAGEIMKNTQGMFQWANLKVEQLCRMGHELDVEAELRKIPAPLSGLYADLLDQIATEGEISQKVARNVFHWLLFAHESLPERDFVRAVTSDLIEESHSIGAKDIIRMCSNLVVVDTELGIFRFSHFSIREYLETLYDYSSTVGHSQLARSCFEKCSQNIIQLRSDHRWYWNEHSLPTYAALYWPIHFYEIKGQDPTVSAGLQTWLARSMKGTLFESWVSLISTFNVNSVIIDRRTQLQASLSKRPDPIFLAAAFDLQQLLETILSSDKLDLEVQNQFGSTPLMVACYNGNLDIARALINHGAKWNFCQDSIDLFSPQDILSQLVRHNDAALVTKLLGMGIDVNKTNALSMAASCGNTDMLRVLLKYKVDITKETPDGRNALECASMKNKYNACCLLLGAGAPADLRAMSVAARAGHFDIAQLLLDFGFNADAFADPSAQSILYDATHAGHITTVELLLQKPLLERGVELFTRNGPYYYLLMDAASAKRNSAQLVEFLIKQGADVNAEGGFWGCALDAAIFCGQEDSTRILLTHGADTTREGPFGNSIDYAIRSQSLGILKAVFGQIGETEGRRRHQEVLQIAVCNEMCFRDHEITEWLLGQDVDVNAGDRAGTTPLHAAAAAHNPGAIEDLLKKSADVHYISSAYGSPVQALFLGEKIASEYPAHYRQKMLDCLNLLLNAGVDINARGGPHGTALEAAAAYADATVVDVLLQRGAEHILSGTEQGCALHAAAGGGNKKITKALLDGGADVNEVTGTFGSALQATLSRGRRPTTCILERTPVNDGANWCSQLNTTIHIGGIDQESLPGTFQCLMDYGADPKLPGGVYGSSLQAAAYTGAEQAIEVLLSRDVDVNFVGGAYGTALQAAACGESDHYWKAIYLTPGIHKTLLEAEQAPQHSNRYSVNIVQQLLNAGADPNIIAGFFGTALQAAAYSEEIVLVDTLLNHGARMTDVRCGFYGDPIQAAISFGKRRITGSTRYPDGRVEEILARLLDSIPWDQQINRIDQAIVEAEEKGWQKGIEMLQTQRLARLNLLGIASDNVE